MRNEKNDEANGRGLDEPGQAEIEARAQELARQAGRSAMNEYDLATAREEILGKSSREVTAPDAEKEPGAESSREQMPS